MKLIGVDIGGTGIKSALIYCKKPSDGSTFKIMHRSSVPTEARFGREHIVEILPAPGEEKKKFTILGFGYVL